MTEPQLISNNSKSVDTSTHENDAEDMPDGDEKGIPIHKYTLNFFTRYVGSAQKMLKVYESAY